MTFLHARRLALTAVCLAALCLSACSKSKKVSAEATGFLESEGTVEDISGWAWDPAQPDTPIRVEIFAEDKLLDSLLADEHREDLVKDGKGNGNHSFEYTFPAYLRDGKAHLIRVRIADVNIELANSPQLLTGRQPTKAGKPEAAKPEASGKPEAAKPDGAGKPKPAKSGKTGDPGGT